jgi:thioesterase domain-containing protein
MEMRFESMLRNHSMSYHLERITMAHDRAWTAYNPKSYDGRVILFAAKRQPFGICVDPMMGWGGLLAGEVQIRVIPGFRQTILDEPNVQHLAVELNSALAASEP